MNKLFDFLKKGPILFVSCHPDDIELGCGGIINQLKNQTKIFVVTLSKNKKNPKHKNLVKEHLQSLRSLGIDSNNIFLADFTTREFSYSRQKILDYLWNLNKKIQPTCVFIPPYDLHQDHQVCNDECQRVFRTQSIIQYHLSRSTNFLAPNMFVKLHKQDLEKKIKAILKYKTHKDKYYFKKSTITALCQTAGVKLEIPLSESFSVISIVL